MEVVWLASYPKSGNTWVRFLFTNLIHGPFETSGTIFEVTPVLERGIERSLLREDRVNVIKTHHKFSEKLPLLNRSKGIVYIVRNPFDLMMSALNYYFLSAGHKRTDNLQEIANQYASLFLEKGGDPNWIDSDYGTWLEHVDSWVDNSAGLPVHIVRYEDLLADTAAELARVCAFIGLDAPAEQIAQAVDRSSFENMRAMEEYEIGNRIPGMFYAEAIQTYGDNGFRFMNSGKKGVALRSIPATAIDRFRDKFMPRLGEFGYA